MISWIIKTSCLCYHADLSLTILYIMFNLIQQLLNVKRVTFWSLVRVRQYKCSSRVIDNSSSQNMAFQAVKHTTNDKHANISTLAKKVIAYFNTITSSFYWKVNCCEWSLCRRSFYVIYGVPRLTSQVTILENRDILAKLTMNHSVRGVSPEQVQFRDLLTRPRINNSEETNL